MDVVTIFKYGKRFRYAPSFNKTGKRQGKRCKRKLTIYKDFCASLEAVFLTQGSVPHSASKRSSIVVFGRHHIQNGSGGLIFILSPKITFFL